MIVTVTYCRLTEPKQFSNGNSVQGGTLLIRSSIEKDGKTLYNTVEPDDICWFYATDEEVEFVEKKEEEWTLEDLEERRNMLDGWL